jgi:hypothetical protein
MLAAKFRTALHAADETYVRLGIQHALIGGVAVGAYSEPYATKDIDFLVGDEAFDSRGAVISFKAGVPLEASGVPVDSVPIDPRYRPLYEQALSTAVRSDEGGIGIVRSDYLAALKLVAGRRHDYGAIVSMFDHGLDEVSVSAVIRGYPDLAARLERALDMYDRDDGDA